MIYHPSDRLFQGSCYSIPKMVAQQCPKIDAAQQGICFIGYPLVNKQLDPENHQFIVETSLPTPIWQGLC